MDKIHIRDLAVWCFVGTNPEERTKKQQVVINITLACDLAPAGRSDRLDDTVNYRTLKKQVATMVEKSEFYLIEKLAQAVAEICLQDERVQAVTVALDKPGALTQARSVAVEICRARSVNNC